MRALILLIIALFYAVAERLTQPSTHVKIGGAEQKIAFIIGDTDLGRKTVKHARGVLKGWRVYDSIQHGIRPDFLYADGTGLQNGKILVPAGLRCVVDARALFDKIRLHMLLMEKAPHTIAPTVMVRRDTQLPPGAVWVIRSNWGYAGSATRIATTQAELETAYDELVKHGNPYRPKDIVEVIGSEYIRDPMLYHGLKFHLRIYVVVYIDNTRLKAWVANAGRIIPGAVKYVAEDFANAQIHDTHRDRNPTMIGTYPSDLPDADPARVNSTIADVIRAVAPNLKKYDETDAGYMLFGIDVMIRADGTPVIIEFNRFPSLSSPNALFDIVIASAFSEQFGPTGDPALVTEIVDIDH